MECGCLTVRKVRLIRGFQMFARFGTWCCQNVWKVPAYRTGLLERSALRRLALARPEAAPCVASIFLGHALGHVVLQGHI
jgi:hypothetical protein